MATRKQKRHSRQTRKHTRSEALRELARRHPNSQHVGFVWKDPFKKQSRGIRWTRSNLDMFRKYQKELK